MKLSRFIILSALSMGLAACGGDKPSNENTASAPQAAATAGANTLRVAIEPVYPPYVLPDGKGNFNGYDVEILKAFAEREGMSITFTPYPWDGLFGRLDTGEADVVAGGLSPNEERRAVMDFTEPYDNTTIVLAVPQNSDVGTFADVKGKNVVFQRNSSDAKIWEKSQPTIVLQNQNGMDSAWLSFRSVINSQESKADAALGHEAVFSHYLKEYKDSGVKLVKDANSATEPMAFAVKKGNAELLNKLNTRLAEMKADGTLAKLHEKWVPHAHNH